MNNLSTVSIIIPTYNRKDSVLRTLESLAYQTLPVEQFNVIVVDDGSSDDTHTIATQQFPFDLQYIRQENQGATIARNHGIQMSQGDIIVFIDDDVTIYPRTLEALLEAHRQNSKVLVMGTLIARSVDEASPLINIKFSQSDHQISPSPDEYLNFTECNTELLSVKSRDLLEIGLIEDPTDGMGWPNWDDVDYGYRAFLKGFELMQSGKAVGIHWDYSLVNHTVACHRWERAGKSAVKLFQKHPGLMPYIPMFFDKTPINFHHDKPKIIIRKIARQIASSNPIMTSLSKLIAHLEANAPGSAFLEYLYRWQSGGFMFRGYREGLREFGQVERPS